MERLLAASGNPFARISAIRCDIPDMDTCALRPKLATRARFLGAIAVVCDLLDSNNVQQLERNVTESNVTYIECQHSALHRRMDHASPCAGD